MRTYRNAVAMSVAAALLLAASQVALAKKKDHDTWTLDIQFVVGIENYNDPAAVERFIDGQIRRAEALYDDKPGLKIRKTVVRKTSAGGKSLASMRFDSAHEYAVFMDANFDTMAKTRRDGFLQVLIVDQICIGWDKDKDTKVKTRHCSIGGRATFPHWVTPFQRKHGIIMLYPDGRDHVLAHELGHFFSLKHTFEPYVNLDPSLNCNREYDPKGEAGKCASCTRGRSGASCSGAANVMDYCQTSSSVFLNSCQQRRAAKQRKKYMKPDGGTDFFQMKGTRGAKICKDDDDCDDGERCDKGLVAGIGRNTCKPKK